MQCCRARQPKPRPSVQHPQRAGQWLGIRKQSNSKKEGNSSMRSQFHLNYPYPLGLCHMSSSFYNTSMHRGIRI